MAVASIAPLFLTGCAPPAQGQTCWLVDRAAAFGDHGSLLLGPELIMLVYPCTDCMLIVIMLSALHL